MVPTASPGTKTTSRESKYLTVRPRGFTLIEILIVLAIITMVMSLGLPAISRVTSQRLNSTTRQFVGRIRTIRNDAILLNTVHRLAIDMQRQKWWVETQRQFQLLAETEPVPKKGTKKGEEPPSNFSIADKYSKEPVDMPSGVVFQGVLKEREGLIKGGVAYVHFFPNGFNDQAILHLNRDGSEEGGYSLLVRPTGGKVEILRDKITDFD